MLSFLLSFDSFSYDVCRGDSGSGGGPAVSILKVSAGEFFHSHNSNKSSRFNDDHHDEIDLLNFHAYKRHNKGRDGDNLFIEEWGKSIQLINITKMKMIDMNEVKRSDILYYYVFVKTDADTGHDGYFFKSLMAIETTDQEMYYKSDILKITIVD